MIKYEKAPITCDCGNKDLIILKGGKKKKDPLFLKCKKCGVTFGLGAKAEKYDSWYIDEIIKDGWPRGYSSSKKALEII